MGKYDNYFDETEDELEGQKEEEISIEEENEGGKIRNSKIPIEDFFDKKKIIIFLSIIGILILGTLYFAQQMSKKKVKEEETGTESISKGTGLDIKDEVAATQEEFQDIPQNEQQQQSLTNTENFNNPTGIPNLSQYDSQLGPEYNNDNLNYSSSQFSESENTSEIEGITSEESVAEKKDWRKSSIGFNKGMQSVASKEETEQALQQQTMIQQIQQQQSQPQPEQDTDQNKQKSKILFMKQKQDGFYSTNTVNPALGRYELKTGSFIPAVLVTAINSDLPGDVIAQVRENVYDYRTGKYILIPMGTKIIGKYDSNVTYGQNRVLLIWQRLVFPNGSTLTLDNLQGVDLLGNAGLKGKTNNHFWKLMRSVLLSSAINIASGSLENLNVNVEGSRSRVNIGTGTTDAARNIQSIGERMVEKDLNRQPTIEIKRGHKFNIFVSKDMLISPYRTR